MRRSIFLIPWEIIYEGLSDRYICTKRKNSYCFVGLWESKEELVSARPKMIAHLDEVRVFVKELLTELGVTDPVSGDIIAYGTDRL